MKLASRGCGRDFSSLMSPMGRLVGNPCSCQQRGDSNFSNPSGASRRLAATDLTEVINPWQDVNQLKRFISAFPVNHSDKRNLSS